VDAGGLGGDEQPWPICRLVRPSATNASTSDNTVLSSGSWRERRSCSVRAAQVGRVRLDGIQVLAGSAHYPLTSGNVCHRHIRAGWAAVYRMKTSYLGYRVSSCRPPTTHARRLEATDSCSYPAAMTEMRSSGTLGDLLGPRRRRRVVGRVSRTEVVWAALDSAKPPHARLRRCGRGGMGKAGFLDSFPRLAADTSVSVTDNLHGNHRPPDAIGLRGTLTRL
jgi:hypothetical protein